MLLISPAAFTATLSAAEATRLFIAGVTAGTTAAAVVAKKKK